MLQLNEPGSEKYKEFYGRNTEQMQKLIGEGYSPLSVAKLMELRINNGEELPDSRDKYVNMGDIVIYNQNEKLKIVYDSQHLREINPQSRIRNGALILEYSVYESLQGPEFTRSELKNSTEKQLSKKQAKENPIWLALARDKAKLHEYVDCVFSETKKIFGYTENMGVYLDLPSDNIKLRSWYVDGFGGRSDADGRVDLDGDYGRLVGVAPGAQLQRGNDQTDQFFCDREVIAENFRQRNNTSPSLEQIISVGKNYVRAHQFADYEAAIKKLYDQK